MLAMNMGLPLLRVPQKPAQPIGPVFGAGQATQPKLSGLQADTFEKTEKAEPGKAAAGNPAIAREADTLKALLTEDDDRKANAAALFKAVTGILPWNSTEPRVDEAKQAQLNRLAESLKTMAPAEKMDLIRQVTGPESPYSRVAESILINQRMPALRDVMDCFKPPVQKSEGIDGLGLGLQAAGLGLLMLPVAAPSALLLSPELLGKVLAGIGILLL